MPYEGAKDGKHYWLTPPDVYDKLNAEFHFDYDPCPHPRPENFDGLKSEWGQSNFVNPPFKGPTAWIRKAIAEYRKGKRVILVFPMDKWIHLLLEAGAEVRNLKDIHWCATEDGTQGPGTGRWIAAFILDPKNATIPTEPEHPLTLTLPPLPLFSQNQDAPITDPETPTTSPASPTTPPPEERLL